MGPEQYRGLRAAAVGLEIDLRTVRCLGDLHVLSAHRPSAVHWIGCFQHRVVTWKNMQAFSCGGTREVSTCPSEYRRAEETGRHTYDAQGRADHCRATDRT